MTDSLITQVQTAMETVMTLASFSVIHKSWQHWHFCTISSGNILETDTS